MDDWKKINETILTHKKDFKIRNLGDYHDLGDLGDYQAQSNTLLLADLFENFGICVLK